MASLVADAREGSSLYGEKPMKIENGWVWTGSHFELDVTPVRIFRTHTHTYRVLRASELHGKEFPSYLLALTYYKELTRNETTTGLPASKSK